jgi:general stress protein 26
LRLRYLRQSSGKLYQAGPSRDISPISAEVPVMSATSDIDRVWGIAEKIKICMLTTHAAGRMRCRPMHAIADRAAGCLWFVTDDRGAKDNEISAAPADVCLAFADTHSNAYLSMTGQAEMSRDPTKARELWSTEAQAWWPPAAAECFTAQADAERMGLGEFEHMLEVYEASRKREDQ